MVHLAGTLRLTCYPDGCSRNYYWPSAGTMTLRPCVVEVPVCVDDRLVQRCAEQTP